MPLNITDVAISANPMQVPCPPAGGTTTVTVSVTYTQSGDATTYDVKLYDRDPSGDKELGSNTDNMVFGGTFTVTDTYDYVLTCDGVCEMVGPNGARTGKQKPELFARATWAPNGSRESITTEPQCGAGAYRAPQRRKKTTKRRKKTTKRAKSLRSAVKKSKKSRRPKKARKPAKSRRPRKAKRPSARRK